MMAPVWILLALLFVLGGLAAVVGLGVFAVVKNRPGIIAGIGGLLLLLVAGGLLFALVGVRSVARGPEARLQVGPVSVMEHVDGRSRSHRMSVGPVSITQDFDGGLSSRHISGRISWIGLLLVLALPVALLFALVRSMSNRRGRECGGGAWVPAIFALALLGFVGFAGAKWKSARHYSLVEHGRRNAEVVRQIAEVQADVARQKAEVARQAAQAQAEINIQQRIAQADIHKLMDEVDAPRIALAPPSPPAPPTPAAVAVFKVDFADAAEPVEAGEVEEAVDADVAAEAEAAVTSIASESEAEGEAASAAGATDSQTANDAADSEAEKPSDAEVESDQAAGKPEAGEAKTEVANDTTESADANDSETASVASSEKTAAGDIPESEQADASVVSPAEGVAAAPVPPSQPLPSWVNDPARRVGETHREVIATDEYATEDECYQAMDIYLLLRTYERIQRLAGLPLNGRLELPTLYHGKYFVQSDGTEVNRHGSFDPTRWQYGHGDSDGVVWDDPRLQKLRAMGITADYVQREIAKKEFLATNHRSFGPMKKLYTQIEFSPAVDRELRARWQADERQERLAAVGAGAGGILGLLGMVYGMLKVDTWTKGYYTKRLFLGVPAAIIGLVSLLALLS